MDGVFSLAAKERQILLRKFREGITPEALRALILLLAAQGWTYLVMQSLLGVSSRTIAASKQRWKSGGGAAWETAQPARTKVLAVRLTALAFPVSPQRQQGFCAISLAGAAG